VPELPEVETVRARLEPILVGRRLDQVEILDSRLTRPHDPGLVAARLLGGRVGAVERRGKYVIVRFESGCVLLIHLRMTGSLLRVHAGEELSVAHARAVVILDNGSAVVYRDVRRFGTWLLLEPDEVGPYLDARLGHEPLERRFGPRVLERSLAARRAPLKAALLDQRVVAGLGNIYADEALWRARLHPLRPAHGLDAAERAALTRGIRSALRTGLARQGATLRDYRTPDGATGSMQSEFRVYGRAGEPCPRCRAPIEKTRVGGRGTWYCPACQPLAAAQAGLAASARSS
jgi:formamidopyrimidine-DNA glycosylase